TPPAAANRDLCQHTRHSQRQHNGDIEHEKSGTTVFSGNIGQAPDVTQPYRSPGDREDKGAPATPALLSCIPAISLDFRRGASLTGPARCDQPLPPLKPVAQDRI